MDFQEGSVGGSMTLGLKGRVRGRTPLLLLSSSYVQQREKKEEEGNDSHVLQSSTRVCRYKQAIQ